MSKKRRKFIKNKAKKGCFGHMEKIRDKMIQFHKKIWTSCKKFFLYVQETCDIRKVGTIVLVLVFIVSTVMVFRQNQNYKNGRESYGAAEQLSGLQGSQGQQTFSEEISNAQGVPLNDQDAGASLEIVPIATAEPEMIEVWVPAPIEDDPIAEMLKETDLDALRQVNEDVIGWIMIPDTVINYPLLQGEDNHYYLDYTWDKQQNRVGSIFMESTNNPDLSDFHTIIYGHNLREKTMFSPIRNYKKQTYWEEHPFVYVVTDEGVYRYDIYSSYEAGVTSDTYRLGFKEQGKQVFIDMGLEQSVIDTGVMPETTDRILTLSTCTGNGHATRWVVHARLKMIMELRYPESEAAPYN